MALWHAFAHVQFESMTWRAFAHFGLSGAGFMEDYTINDPGNEALLCAMWTGGSRRVAHLLPFNCTPAGDGAEGGAGIQPAHGHM
jgi:hypothetical protein